MPTIDLGGMVGLGQGAGWWRNADPNAYMLHQRILGGTGPKPAVGGPGLPQFRGGGMADIPTAAELQAQAPASNESAADAPLRGLMQAMQNSVQQSDRRQAREQPMVRTPAPVATPDEPTIKRDDVGNEEPDNAPVKTLKNLVRGVY